MLAANSLFQFAVINLLHGVWPGDAQEHKSSMEGHYQFLFISLILLSLSSWESFILLRRIPRSLFCHYGWLRGAEFVCGLLILLRSPEPFSKPGWWWMGGIAHWVSWNWGKACHASSLIKHRSAPAGKGGSCFLGSWEVLNLCTQSWAFARWCCASVFVLEF